MFPKTFLGAAMSAILLATPALAAPTSANFAGHWKLIPAKSRNLGMMASANIVRTVEQTPTELVVDDSGTFDGQVMVEHSAYGLAGKASVNNSQMAGLSTGQSHWDDGRLITDWQSAGAIAGTSIQRQESIRLESDGKVMVVESGRPGKAQMLFVFERQ